LCKRRAPGWRCESDFEHERGEIEMSWLFEDGGRKITAQKCLRLRGGEGELLMSYDVKRSSRISQPYSLTQQENKKNRDTSN
jgi:hypothetical protein